MNVDAEPGGGGAEPDWVLLTPEESVVRQKSDLQSGLARADAAARLDHFGPNQIIDKGGRSAIEIALSQFQNSLVVLLLGAVAVSLVLGEITDGVAILAIIILNSVLGFWQDFRAERSLQALRNLSLPEATVHRDGIIQTISVEQLVPGDVVLLTAGGFVPADCRIVESFDYEVDEAALTGESVATTKTVAALADADVALGDQENMVFKGTIGVHGHATGLVVRTGMKTELGKIASSLGAIRSEPTPLQTRLAGLSRALAIIALGVVAVVFVAGIIAGQEIKLMFMGALSLAVAIVPEGLPAVATVALALGARRMFRRNALIRQLPAVETLGSVSVICSDKTGTLTQNRMSATVLQTADDRIDVDSSSHSPPEQPVVQILLACASLCNDAEMQFEDQMTEPVFTGEPTEVALLQVANQFGYRQNDLRTAFPRIGEIPFDGERKRMATAHNVDTGPAAEAAKLRAGLPATIENTGQLLFVKGSLESVLQVSSWQWAGESRVELNQSRIDRIQSLHDELAATGVRVLAFGFRPLPTLEPSEGWEQDVILLGFIGLKDPPRPEARQAVKQCREAGIRPIMITGDHPLTAVSVARELDITTDHEFLTGTDLKRISPEELQQRVCTVSVFARVAPTDKLNIVEALQANRDVVAMTGDGVNDAPALKQAHIGVAMGKTGTDISREAADMILLNDNFATIVAAVEQGRIVYDNIRKFVQYTMSSNVGEMLVMLWGLLLGYPLPLLPLQILWVNLVTDGLPGLALALEPAEKDTMQKKPRSSAEPVLDRRMTLDIIVVGSLIGAFSLMTGALYWAPEGENRWRTIIFTALTMAQMGNAIACRSVHSVFDRSRPRNFWLWGAIALTFFLQVAVVYAPPLQVIFHTSSLSIFEFAVCTSLGFLVVLAIELIKALKSWYRYPGESSASNH